MVTLASFPGSSVWAEKTAREPGNEARGYLRRVLILTNQLIGFSSDSEAIREEGKVPILRVELRAACYISEGCC